MELKDATWLMCTMIWFDSVITIFVRSIWGPESPVFINLLQRIFLPVCIELAIPGAGNGFCSEADIPILRNTPTLTAVACEKVRSTVIWV